jgi:hypothetical protein
LSTNSAIWIIACFLLFVGSSPWWWSRWSWTRWSWRSWWWSRR